MAAAAEPADRPFVGRAEAIDQLRRRQDEARAGRGGLSLVVGEAGVGKSSLLRLLAEESAARGMVVLAGSPDPSPSAAPLALIASVLASDRKGVGASRPRREPSSSLASMVPLAPSASPVVGFAPSADAWARRGSGAEEASPEAPAGPAEGGGTADRRSFPALAGELRRLVEAGPTLVILEDLDSADDASLEFLVYALPELARHPIWFVGSTLPLPQVPEARRAYLERLQREAGVEEVLVRPLTPQELPELLHVLAPDHDATAEEIALWHAQSGGNPLFLDRLLRRTVGPLPGAGPVAPAPEELEALARSLDALPPEEARVLGFCAVLGPSFPFALLNAATGEDEERLAEIVESLVNRGILREGVDERLEFLREGLRGRIYAQLTIGHRRLLHRKAGEALEATGAADTPTIYALALHCYLGRIDDRSALYNRTAGELAAHHGSPTVAKLHFERALESHRRAHPADALGELELLLDLVAQLDRLGELREADRVLTDALRRPALSEAASPGQRALARLYRARLYADQGRWGDADTLTQELLSSPEAQLGARTLMAAHRLRGELLYYRGEYLEALHHHELAQRIARSLHDEREIALEAVRVANALAMLPGRATEAMASYRLASETLVGLGDFGEAAYAQLFLGVVESQHGRTLEGLRELDKALTLAEEGHDPRRTGWARFNLADLERERGDLEAARRHNARALQILTGVGDRFGLLQVHLIEGKIRLAEGQPARAEVELLEAFRLAHELQAPADELEVLLRLTEVALAQGDLARARSRCAEAERVGLDRRPELAQEWAAVRARLEAPGAL